jgi:DNA-binding CsgD family transcriptional regulator
MNKKLTEKQREALHLLAFHRTSKEIAIALGVSPSAADHRLDAVCRKLGVQTRREAARVYLEGLMPTLADEPTI